MEAYVKLKISNRKTENNINTKVDTTVMSNLLQKNMFKKVIWVVA